MNIFPNQGISFEAYMLRFQSLVETGETTGPDQSEQRVQLTKLNYLRSKRILKTISVPPTLLAEFDQSVQYHWLVLAEPWCGDCANVLPLIAKLAALSPNINLRIVYRDEQPEIMGQFLTNGARSVPKWICFNRDGDFLGTWGPRPNVLQYLVRELKQDPAISSEQFKQCIQRWYLNDAGQTFFEEASKNMQQWQALALGCSHLRAS